MGAFAKLGIGLAVGVLATGAVALTLIASDRPAELAGAAAGGLDFTVLAAAAGDVERRAYTARDGARLGVRRWDSGRADAPLVVAVHGSGWHGGQFRGLGAALAGAGLADVVAPDLRGHGPDPLRRGDVDYIGQMEDDLADLIAAQARPGQRVVMLGHSSGGGLVVRFAGGAHGGLIDAAVLIAPFLQHDAPTARPGSGGWARVLLRRIIGLSMLNAAGITVLNHLTVIQFHFPAAVLAGPEGATATTAYSFRLNTGYAPRRDWRADVAALPSFLLVAGRRDEAFVASAYEGAMAPATPNGRYLLIEAGHLDAVDHPATFAAIAAFLDGQP